MTRPFFETNTVSVVVGIVSIVAGAVLLHYYLNRKNTAPPRKPNRNVRLRTLLDPNDKYQLPLLEKEVISNDTRRFRFGLPSNQHILGLPVGQHIHLIANIENDLVIRPYTPISSDDDLGYVDLLIKVYHKDVHPKFPLGGKMTQYLNAMEVGDKISFRGPSGRLQYLGNGHFSIKKLRKDPPKTVVAKRVNMIAGGTGITPMLQLIRHVLKNSAEDHTEMALYFANQSEHDILMREELDKLAVEHPQQFNVWYTVDKSDNEAWPYSVGYIKDDMMRDHLFPAAKDCLCLLCGPPPMVNYTCIPGLERLGHDVVMRFSY